MALTKNATPTSDVIDILAPDESEERPMQFSKEAVKHVMGRLINMYGDPILSTVREVISNATDATTMLPEGQRRPIEISSPSSFKPYFMVTDHGVGMSPQDVDDVFRRFESTKKNVLNAIGSHGLGAKAPLAYCGEFTTSTIKDGINTVFRVRNGSNGYAIKVIETVETDAPSGTTVTIPVRMEDRVRFEEVLYSYKNFSFDTPMMIDGKLTKSNERYVELDPIVLDEDTQSTGRVWARKDSLDKILSSAFRNSGYSSYTDIELAYNLAGWLYPSDNSSYNYSNSGYGRKKWESPELIVEIIPALVDFSSSRDSITDNERSVALNNKIRPMLLRMSDYLVKNFMKGFKTCTPIESLQLLSSLKDMIKLEDDDVVFKSSNSVQEKIVVSKSEFVTNDGFDPIGITSKAHDPNIIEVVNTTTYDLYEPCDSNYFFTSYFAWGTTSGWSRSAGPSIGSRNGRMKERVAASTPDISLIDFITGRLFFGNSNSGMKKMTVITGVNDENIVKLCRSRQIITEGILPHQWAFYTTLDSIPQDQVDNANLLVSSPIEFITAADLIAKADVIRKANAARNKKDKPDLSKVSLYQYLTAEESKGLSSSDVVKNVNKAGTRVTVTMDEIIAENAILILGDSRTATLMGAANAGIKITERPIYSSDKWSLSAIHYKALENYPGAIASLYWKYNSASARLIGSTRRYNANVLDEDLKSIDPVEAVSNYLRSNHVRFTSEVVNAIYPLVEDEELKRTVKLIADGHLLSRTSKAHSIIRNYSSLVTSIGSENALKVRAFIDTMDKLASSHNIEDRLAAMLASSGYQFEDSEITRPILKMIASRYSDQVTAKRIAEAEAKAARDAADAENSEMSDAA